MPISSRLVVQTPFNKGNRVLDNLFGCPAAFSLERLNSLYTGPCIRVRRSSDSTQADIGFTNDWVDDLILRIFCGSGDGFVVTWYDQSGNGQHATNATAATQPRIVLAGVVEASDTGRPEIKFLANGYKLTTPSFTGYANGFTITAVARALTSSNIPAICSKTNNNNVAGPWGFSTQTSSGSTVTRVNLGDGTSTTAVSPSTANKMLNPYMPNLGSCVWQYGTDKTAVFSYLNGNQNMGAIASVAFTGGWTPGTMTYGDPGGPLQIGVFGIAGTAGGLQGISEVITMNYGMDFSACQTLYKSRRSAFRIKEPINVVFIGDSLTLGQSATPDNGPAPAVFRILAGGTVFVHNYGVGGTTLEPGTAASSITTFASAATGAFNRKDLGPNAILCVGGCANDFANGRTPEQVYGYMKTLLTAAKNSDLFRRAICVKTGTPRSKPSDATDAGTQAISGLIFAYNDMLRYGFNGTLAQTGSYTTTQIQAAATANELKTVYGVTHINDLQAITGIFDTLLAPNNATYYNADKIHYTDSGYSQSGTSEYNTLLPVLAIA